jgi:hypothetical protein
MTDQNATDSAVLLKRIEDLEAQLAQVAQAQRASEAPTSERSEAETTTSRRGLLKLAGAAAAGAAATSLLAAAPAAAADGGNLVIGSTANVEEAETWLGYDGIGPLASRNMMTVYDYGGSLDDIALSFYPSALAGWAINGAAAITSGVYGYSAANGGFGVVGVANANAASHGVLAQSSQGYGIVATGPLAPIYLVPAASAGAPASGAHAQGEVYVDSNGTMYRCQVSGTPGKWAPMYSPVPLASPVRVIDSRNGTGGITGPLVAGTTATSSNLTGGSAIPAEAIAVFGTVTMVATGQNLPGAGYLTVFPGGAAVPTASNVNAGNSHAIASGLNVKLGSGGNAGKLSVVASTPCHVVIDIAGYIL